MAEQKELASCEDCAWFDPGRFPEDAYDYCYLGDTKRQIREGIDSRFITIKTCCSFKPISLEVENGE